jgi:hypothetical protein
MIIFANKTPTALTKEIKFGSSCSLRAAATKIGKYGIGTKTIMLPTKLAMKTLRYPKLSNIVNSQSSVVNRNTAAKDLYI